MFFMTERAIPKFNYYKYKASRKPEITFDNNCIRVKTVREKAASNNYGQDNNTRSLEILIGTSGIRNLFLLSRVARAVTEQADCRSECQRVRHLFAGREKHHPFAARHHNYACVGA